MRINARRLQESLESMARIGATEGGGVHRLALSDEDKAGRELFISWLNELGLNVTVDEVGNIFGERPGQNPGLPPVMSGSHLDTQPFGGRFDGVLGVLGMLEVLRTLEDHGQQTRRPVCIVTWSNEEGARFAPAMVGSGVWTGNMERDWLYSLQDVEGKKFGDELTRIGFRGQAPARRRPVHAYFELHVEQGPQLELAKRRAGVPKGIVSLNWLDVFVTGDSNQAGPTPMNSRKDALAASAEMIQAVEKLPSIIGGDLVATVGEIHNSPNTRNTISGRVHFTVDIRSWDDDLAKRAKESLFATLEGIARNRKVGLEHKEIWTTNHAPFDQRLVDMAVQSAQELGHEPMIMVSGAGHDASYLSQIVPTAMIFTPSVGGRSHVEVELTSWEDCALGADVLLQCVLKAAMEE